MEDTVTLNLTEEEFGKEFKPLLTPEGDWRQIDDAGSLEWQQAARSQKLWTVVAGDTDGMYLVEGNRVCNRLYNVITEVPWDDDKTYQVTLWEPDEETEEE